MRIKMTAIVVKSICTVVIAVALLLAPVAGRADTAKEKAQASAELLVIINKVVNAYGGRAAIEKAKSVMATGEISASVRGDNGTYTHYLKREKKLRVETKYSRSSETRILNGSRGWRGVDTTKPAEVESFPLLAMVYQYKRLDLPYGLMMNRYTVYNVGDDTVAGVAVRILELHDSEGPPMRIAVEKKTFRIISVEGQFQMGDKATSLSVEYSDFRMVDGVLFPFRQVNYGGGMRIGENIIKEYKVNPKMEDSLFRP